MSEINYGMVIRDIFNKYKKIGIEFEEVYLKVLDTFKDILVDGKKDNQHVLPTDIYDYLVKKIEPCGVYDFYLFYEIIMAKAQKQKLNKNGVFFTPYWVAKLMQSMVDYGSGLITEYYDPTCGLGNLLSVLPDTAHKCGQELDPYTASVASDICKNSDIRVGNTLLDDKFSDKQFDAILANPPYNIMKWNDKKEPIPPRISQYSNNANYAFLQHIRYKLTAKGKAAILFSSNVAEIMSKDEEPILHTFLQDNIIDTVVRLPKNVFQNTSIYTYLILFDNNRPTKRSNHFDNIFFIDLLEDKHKKGFTEEEYKNCFEIFRNRSDIENKALRVPYSTVLEKNSIAISSYIINNSKERELYSLEEIVEGLKLHIEEEKNDYIRTMCAANVVLIYMKYIEYYNKMKSLEHGINKIFEELDAVKPDHDLRSTFGIEVPYSIEFVEKLVGISEASCKVGEVV